MEFLKRWSSTSSYAASVPSIPTALNSKAIHVKNVEKDKNLNQNYLLCGLCDFRCDNEKGLNGHMNKKHKTVNQLDGNVTFNVPMKDKWHHHDTSQLERRGNHLVK